MRTLTRIDRRLGAGVRRASAATPGAPAAARALAAGMSPAFRVVVAAMVLRRPTRAAGLRALAAGAGASLVARALRDRLGRRRPGARADGGFPSRHAAASVAIAAAAGRDHARIGSGLAVATAAGLLARVADAEHEPADIVAGAALGLLAAHLVERIAPAG
ncbi:phosphatase PAP2 family protein [Miltoncostaea oceani]|uniref:phosphatase PAP2 family protein n=1 Tax=Miltoncostaea oceani TaxID=2843216 RepID=UPI001C3E630A|nr:phosphatase PAP2 family protein [Miltoncostaea oceani]